MTLSRKNYVHQMFGWGKGGEKDYNTTAKIIKKQTPELLMSSKFGPRLKILPNQFDVKDYDMPRNDIKRVKINNKYIYIGGDKKDIQKFKVKILPKLKNIFVNTDDKNFKVYIELSSKDKDLISNKKTGIIRYAVEQCYISGKNKNYAIIDTNNNGIRLSTITHELIHASRCVSKNRSNNDHKEETETALETVSRLPLKYLKEQLKNRVHGNTGYYDFLGGTPDILSDKQLIDSKCKNIKNLRTCIKKNIKNTKINKLKKYDKPVKRVVKKCKK